MFFFRASARLPDGRRCRDFELAFERAHDLLEIPRKLELPAEMLLHRARVEYAPVGHRDADIRAAIDDLDALVRLGQSLYDGVGDVALRKNGADEVFHG